jgi:hypothetical protein
MNIKKKTLAFLANRKHAAQKYFLIILTEYFPSVRLVPNAGPLKLIHSFLHGYIYGEISDNTLSQCFLAYPQELCAA